MRPIRLSTLLLFVFLSGTPLIAQGDLGDDPRKWLDWLDGRIDRPQDLSALGFQFRPVRLDPSNRSRTIPAEYVVRYAWRAGKGDRIDLLTPEGEPVTAIEGDETGEALKALQASMLRRARSFGRRVRPPTLVEEFAAYDARVLRRKLAERDVVTLRFTPRQPQSAVEAVELELGRDGMPWRRVRKLRSGDRIEGLETWEARGDRFVLTKLNMTERPRGGTRRGTTFGFRFGYELKGGRRLLTSIEAVGPELPPLAQGKTTLTELKVNDAVPAFEPMR